MPRDAAIDLAKATLAKEVAVGADLIELVDAAEAEWRDSSLGCAQRGMAYAPVITAGYRVTLGIGGDRFVVHVASGRAVVCGKPQTSGGGVRNAKLPPADPLAGLRLAEQARADLASRLRVGKDRVTISFFRATLWPDPSLGCPIEAETYPQQPTKGFLIELTADGKAYEYHSDMDHVVTCSDAMKSDAKPAVPRR